MYFIWSLLSFRLEISILLARNVLVSNSWNNATSITLWNFTNVLIGRLYDTCGVFEQFWQGKFRWRICMQRGCWRLMLLLRRLEVICSRLGSNSISSSTSPLPVAYCHTSVNIILFKQFVEALDLCLLVRFQSLIWSNVQLPLWNNTIDSFLRSFSGCCYSMGQYWFLVVESS